VKKDAPPSALSCRLQRVVVLGVEAGAAETGSAGSEAECATGGGGGESARSVTLAADAVRGFPVNDGSLSATVDSLTSAAAGNR
jgi:hypothetical protein